MFRLGELHIVFVMLKVIGKNNEEIHLDKIPADSKIYGEITLKQILGGKNMKMSVETTTTLYSALFRVFINDWYNRGPGIKHMIENLQKCLPDNLKESGAGLKKILEENNILKALENSEMHYKIKIRST